MSSESVRDFRVPFSSIAWQDLRDRLRRTRWPEPAPSGEREGIPVDRLRELCDYWADGYDWPGRVERLNRVPHVLSRIDGVDVHAVHLRSPRSDALPLVLTHGWPGSFVEFLAVADLLANPADGETPFHVVLPSLPGYAYSGRPTDPGWGVERIAAAWAELLTRLGYRRFVAGGSDWGTSVSEELGRQMPDRVHGLFLVPPLAGPADEPPTTNATWAPSDALRDDDGGDYGRIHRTRPQTIGYALVDSPVALAAWAGEKIWDWADRDSAVGEEPRFGALPRDEVLDDLTIYWMTGTGASSVRLYRESIGRVDAILSGRSEPVVTSPVGGVVFPKESPRPRRSWAQRRFPDIRSWSIAERGGHFGAWEQPEIFARELRSFVAGLDPATR